MIVKKVIGFNLDFKKLTNPIISVEPEGTLTHWILCPVSGEPILLGVVEDDPKDQSPDLTDNYGLPVDLL